MTNAIESLPTQNMGTAISYYLDIHDIEQIMGMDHILISGYILSPIKLYFTCCLIYLNYIWCFVFFYVDIHVYSAHIIIIMVVYECAEFSKTGNNP